MNSVRRRFTGLESLAFALFRRFDQTNLGAKGKDLLPSHRQNLRRAKKPSLQAISPRSRVRVGMFLPQLQNQIPGF